MTRSEPRATNAHAVLFDLDGTLLDSFEQYRRSLNGVLSEVGFSAAPLSRFQELRGLGGIETLAALGVPPHRVSEARERWVRWEAALASLVHPFAGTVLLLERLRGAGLPLAIVTSRPLDSVHTTPAAMDLIPLVDLLVTRDATHATKPDPAPVLWALRRLGVPPTQGVYVGDTRFDVESGRRAGCLAVLVAWNHDGLAMGGGHQPHFVAASPQQLGDWLLEDAPLRS